MEHYYFRPWRYPEKVDLTVEQCRDLKAKRPYHQITVQCSECERISGVDFSIVEKFIARKGVFKIPKYCMNCYSLKNKVSRKRT
jgi:hypothetical protein